MSGRLASVLLLMTLCGLAGAQSVTTPPLRIHGAGGDSTRAVQLQPSAIVLMPGSKPGISSVALVGGVEESGIYLIRVRMEPGAANAPHVHPDARVTTVMSGVVYYGIGPLVDRSHAQAMVPGSVYFTPAGTAHWLIAGDDGPAVYEESGFGPSLSTRLAPLKP